MDDAVAGPSDPESKGPEPDGAAVAGTALLLTGLAGFQAALAAGAPWGRVAYGGAREGVLPNRLRGISGGATVVYLAAAGALAGGVGSAARRRQALAGISTFMLAGTALNAASRSRPERLLWTPYCAVTAALAWRARPDVDRQRTFPRQFGPR